MAFYRQYEQGRLAVAPFYANKDWRVTSRGYARLSSSITINGSTVSPMYRFHGSDATASGWTPQVGAVSLAEASTGGVTTSPTYSTAGAWGTGVDYNAGKYHQAGSDAYGIGTEDFYLECAAVEVSSNLGVFGKYSSSPVAGYYLSCQSFGRVYFLMRSGGTTVTVTTTSSTLVEGTLYFFSIVCDRSEASSSGLRIYANGSLIGSGNPSSLSASTLDDSSSVLRIGTSPETTTNRFTQPLYYVAGWKSAGWFAGGATNDSQWLEFHQERYATVIA